MAIYASSTPAPTIGAPSFRAALSRSRRRALEDWIEHALALLDDLDGDSELELDACAELSLQAEIRGSAIVRAA